jgi:uncharacterized protein DUF4388
MPLPDLLQWLSDAKKQGLLTVTLEFDERTLRFADGQIVALGADDALQRDLGRVLCARGLLDTDKLSRALDLRGKTGAPLGDILIAEGMVARGKLNEAIADHIREVVLTMFLWREASFVFSENPSPLVGSDFRLPEHRLPSPMGTRELLMEGMRRVDEWQRISQVFPSEYMQVFALDDDGHIPVLSWLKLQGEPMAIGEIALGRPESRYEIYEQLYQAQQKGLIAIDAAAHEMVPPTGRSPTDVLLDSAAALLAERQYDEATTLLRAAENLDPFRAETRELLRRAHDDHLDALYQQMPPFRVPQVAAPRERIAAAKLGPREHFLISRVSGHHDVGTLCVMTPLGELETLKLLAKLERQGLIKL